MRYSVIVITLLSVCYAAPVISENNTGEKLLRGAKASANQQVFPHMHQKIRAQLSFDLIDSNSNGALSRKEFTVRSSPRREYRHEEINVLNAQIIRLDSNMDGFLQASEYANLVTEGSVYGALPEFSEVSENDRIDYCRLTTKLGTHHALRNFVAHDADNDDSISFEEYVAHNSQGQLTQTD